MTDSKIIVALDLPSWDKTMDMAFKLKKHVAMVKVGLEAYTAHGPEIVRTLRDNGMAVMLDLKVHDIPRTAAAAVARADKLGAKFITVHAFGGREMLQAARTEANNIEIIAVTVLTSLNQQMLTHMMGSSWSVEETVKNWGRMAMAYGAHGLVCSAKELGILSDIKQDGYRIVPGVRPAGADHGDQKRVVTPKEAVDGGATWIVVGRPIVQADDPVAAAKAINESIEAPAPCCHYLHGGFPLCDFIRVVPGEWPEGHTWIRVDDEENSLTVKLCPKCVEVRKDPNHVLRV